MERTYAYMARQLDRYSRHDEEERCGIVVSLHGGRFSLVELPNRHPMPTTNFRIYWTDVHDAIARYGGRYHGYFHTHPGDSEKNPSTEDKLVAGIQKCFAHYVYHPLSRRLVEYNHLGVIASSYIPPRLRFTGQRSTFKGRKRDD